MVISYGSTPDVSMAGMVSMDDANSYVASIISISNSMDFDQDMDIFATSIRGDVYYPYCIILVNSYDVNKQASKVVCILPLYDVYFDMYCSTVVVRFYIHVVQHMLRLIVDVKILISIVRDVKIVVNDGEICNINLVITDGIARTAMVILLVLAPYGTLNPGAGYLDVLAVKRIIQVHDLSCVSLMYVWFSSFLADVTIGVSLPGTLLVPVRYDVVIDGDVNRIKLDVPDGG